MDETEADMALRQIIEINEDLCDACGVCENACPEGALRVIDGKARLVGESLCDGLGACLSGCPRNAIRVTRREAEAYDERAVVAGIVAQGPAVLKAHFEHLERHGQEAYVKQAEAWLAENGVERPERATSPTTGQTASPAAEGIAGAVFTCPSSRPRALKVGLTPHSTDEGPSTEPTKSALAHWPVQLHLVNPRAPHFAGARLLAAADCTAFALGSFHSELLDGRALVIACTKLDSGRESYLEKLTALVASASTVEVAVMEVPCCSGLVRLVLEARERSGIGTPVKVITVGIEGGILREEER